MSSALTFQDTAFDIVDRHGQPWLRGHQIGVALGYHNGQKKIHDLYTRHKDEFTDSMTAVVKLPDLHPQFADAGGQTGDAGQLREVRIFSLRGAHLLGMFARTARAAAFRRWVLAQAAYEGFRAEMQAEVRAGALLEPETWLPGMARHLLGHTH